MSEAILEQIGVHRISIPVPFSAAGGPVNVYVFEEKDGGIALLDAGIKTEEGEAALREGFRALGRTFREVRRIFISHGHIDHYGMAGPIASEAGCPVFIHPRDREKVQDATRHIREAGAYATYLGRLGLSPEQIEAIRLGAELAQGFAWGLGQVEPVQDGERLEFAGCAVEVLHLPGHTPGLVCLWDAEHRILFADDHLLERVSPNPLLELGPHGEDDKFRALATYMESARRAQRLPAELICPGHGPPFSGHTELIERLVGFYEKRQGKLMESLAGGERTALELVAALFGRVRASQIYLQLSEVIGNLEILEDQGRVGRRLEGEVYRYRAA